MKPPAGLGGAGLALWSSLIADVPDGCELTALEVHALARAARTADEVAALEAAIDEHGVVTTGSRGQIRANPALAAVTALRQLEAKLLGSINLDVDEAETPAQVRARKAARARWTRTARRSGRPQMSAV